MIENKYPLFRVLRWGKTSLSGIFDKFEFISNSKGYTFSYLILTNS